ncbi:hypothetical protein [Lutispora sp.]|uniref:hypothetical protein n=1 Tax=Lutispora sp. TaxID=2828727 RepID=UPI003569E95A
MKVFKKKILWMLLLIMIMITVACGNREINKENEGFDEETENTVSSQKVSSTEETLPISSKSNKIPENEPIDSSILKSSETRFEDLSYIDEDIYSALSKIISTIDFYGTFDNEDIVDSNSISKKYYKVVVGESPYINEAKEKEGFEGEFDSIKPNECIYYYFDMDKDGLPELIVSDQQRYEYIFKYDAINNEIMLISIIRTTSQLLGGNKISYWQGGVGLTYGFYELYNSGERKSDIRFFSAAYLNNKTQQEDEIYMVGFTENSEEIETLKALTQNGKVEVYFNELSETHYFRITEEQYNQLAKDYFKSRKEAEENIKEVTYSFEELFGEFK